MSKLQEKVTSGNNSSRNTSVLSSINQDRSQLRGRVNIDAVKHEDQLPGIQLKQAVSVTNSFNGGSKRDG